MQSNSIFLQENFLGKRIRIVSKHKVTLWVELIEIHSWGVVAEDDIGIKSLIPWHLIEIIADKMPDATDPKQENKNMELVK